MTPFITAGAGFLLAVLWFDLMFDVQVARRGSDDPLASIAAYYRRVTTTARPMNRLVAAVMVATLVAIAVQIGEGDVARWISVASLVLLSAAVLVAGLHTVPSAVRLGSRNDDEHVQRRLAKGILRDHIVCLVAVACLLVLQLAA